MKIKKELLHKAIWSHIRYLTDLLKNLDEVDYDRQIVEYNLSLERANCQSFMRELASIKSDEVEVE